MTGHKPEHRKSEIHITKNNALSLAGFCFSQFYENILVLSLCHSLSLFLSLSLFILLTFSLLRKEIGWMHFIAAMVHFAKLLFWKNFFYPSNFFTLALSGQKKFTSSAFSKLKKLLELIARYEADIQKIL